MEYLPSVLNSALSRTTVSPTTTTVTPHMLHTCSWDRRQRRCGCCYQSSQRSSSTQTEILSNRAVQSLREHSDRQPEHLNQLQHRDATTPHGLEPHRTGYDQEYYL
uniref:N-(5'-phosphoribosyl)anthranilate isomerase n=1 Tax=Lygus hesperus TaxID=30085 RepID=A0A0A9WF41_LYGHE